MSAGENHLDTRERSGMKKENYHHGNLRETLIAEGLRLLALQDADAISLREIARAAGVSATSVYRHFPDKEALMSALAQEGLVRLAAAQRAAAATAGEGKAGFSATGRAYVRFALANPALFRVIFASPALVEARRQGLASEADALLYENAARAAADAGQDAGAYAVRSWALVHGLAMLMLDGQIPVDESLIDQVIA